MGHSLRGQVCHQPTGKVLVIQPRNFSLDGRISFGDDAPLRTDAPSPRWLQPNEMEAKEEVDIQANLKEIAEIDVELAVLEKKMAEHLKNLEIMK
ncbi:MAG: hypothetical protein COA70_10125 [Planctomycetota bacterium]|nr:MAG: hypothetical protein COA70_10125 [Planctomycetota bacterium]